MVKACRRTLLSVWRSKPDTDGEVPYDDFGEVTLSTMPLSCFPNIRFPADAHDAGAVRQFVMGLSFALPLQRDMTEARTYEAGGKTFVMTQGTIAYKTGNEALSRRISVALAMTEHRGYLLIWLLAAPHEGELRELLQAKVGFSPSMNSVNSPAGRMAGEETPPKPDASMSGAEPAVGAPTPETQADSGSTESQPQAHAAVPPAAAMGAAQPGPAKPSLETPPR